MESFEEEAVGMGSRSEDDSGISAGISVSGDPGFGLVILREIETQNILDLLLNLNL